MLQRIFFSCSIVLTLAASLQATTSAEDLLKKPDSWFSSDEGRQTLKCILTWQSAQGDWPKNTDTTSKEFWGQVDLERMLVDWCKL